MRTPAENAAERFTPMPHDRPGCPLKPTRTAKRVEQTLAFYFDALDATERAALTYAVDLLVELEARTTKKRHGTRAQYNKRGCRCDLCVAAAREYERQRRAAKA